MAANFTNLRHGDVVVIECDGPTDWEGVLSSDPRSGQELEVVYTRKGSSLEHPDFLSKCVFRVDSSRGEEAPGQPVNFGNPVRLQLLRTRQLLTSTTIPSKNAKRSFRLGLNKSKSKECYITLLPHLKIRSEGEMVYYGEPTGMKDSNGRFICALDSQIDSLARNVAVGGVTGVTSSFPAPSVVVSSEQRYPWRFRRFMAYDASLEACVKAGDLVRLFHMEEEAFVVGHVVDDDLRNKDSFKITQEKNEKLEAIYSRTFVDVDKTLKDPKRMFVGLRESASKRKARSKHSIKSIWEVHNEQDSFGGPITFGQHVRLRHFSTGAFLAIRRDFNGVSCAMAIPVIESIKDSEDTLFSFEYVSSNETLSADALYCTVNSLSRIKHVATGEYVVGANKTISAEDALTDSNLSGGDSSSMHASEDAEEEDDAEYEEGEEGEAEQSRTTGAHKEKPISTVAKLPDDSVFQMSAVAATDVDNCFVCQGMSQHIVAFIEYTQEVLNGATAIETSGGKSPVVTNSGLLKPLQDALTSLVGFVCGGIKVGKWTEAKNVTSTPLKLQQHVMIEQSMIELLLMLCQTIFAAVKRLESLSNTVPESSAHSKSEFSKKMVAAARKKSMLMKFLKQSLPSKAILCELGLLSYKLLELIITSTKKSVAHVMDVEGVDTMIKHKLNTNPSWAPPIKELLLSNTKGCSKKRLKTVYKTDIKFLLDKVFERIVMHQVPDPDLLVFLGDICAPNDEADTSVQMWVRELLLGFTVEHAQDSCFLYGMRMGEKGVEVETSLYGKVRPKYSPDLVVEFSDFVKDGKPKSSLRQQPGGTIERYKPVSPDLDMTYEEWAEQQDMSQPNACDGNWVLLKDLQPEQYRFLTAGLQLLGMLCAGRNGSSQELARALAPVDVLLSIMEDLADLSRALPDNTKKKKVAVADRPSLHIATITVLRNLYVHSVMLDAIVESNDSTLVWTLGENPMPDDYEDVRLTVSNRIFSASTQFKEPRSMLEAFEKPDAVMFLEKYDREYIESLSSEDKMSSSVVIKRAKKILKQRWVEFMLLDLKSFVQRARMRSIIATTLSSAELVRHEVNPILSHGPSLAAVHAFLCLVKDLAVADFFSPTYDIYPRCGATMNQKDGFPFFYRLSIGILEGEDVHKGEFGKTAPVPRFDVGKHAQIPVLAPGAASKVPTFMCNEDDSAILPALPHGMELKAVNRVTLKDIDDGDSEDAVLVMVPEEDYFEGRPQDESIQEMRDQLTRLQALLNPRKDHLPGSGGLPTLGSEMTWRQLADEGAEEHFLRSYCYIQKTGEDGQLQEQRMKIHQCILEIWYVTITTNQKLRAYCLWETFQRCYKDCIEDPCFPVLTPEELEGETGDDGDDGDDDEVKEEDEEEKNEEEEENGDDNDDDEVEKALDLGDRSEEYRYLIKKSVKDSNWSKFRAHSKKKIAQMISGLSDDTLMGDMMESPENMELQKRRGLDFLDLVLYNNQILTAMSVRMLQRHFNRRVELNSSMVNATLVLEEEDKDTLKFAFRRRTQLQRCFALFSNPHAGSNIKNNLERAKFQKRRMRNLRDMFAILYNNPKESGGVIGLINLSWTRLWKADGDDNDDNDSQASRRDSTVLEEQDPLFAFQRIGPHPLVRGLPRKEVLEEMNQQLMGELGLHLPVLDFLEGVMKSSTNQDEFMNAFAKEQIECIRACLIFLFYFCSDHDGNAELLSTPEAIKVLCDMLNVWDGTEAIILLTEVLVDNDIANSLLEVTQINSIVALLVSSAKESMALPEADWTKPVSLLNLLAAVCESDEGYIVARQELVCNLMEEALGLGGKRKAQADDVELLAAVLFIDHKTIEEAREKHNNEKSEEDDYSVSSETDSFLEVVPSLYKVEKVEKAYEKLTRKRKPPKAPWDNLAAWRKYHSKCKSLSWSTHLSFHLQFIDLLGLVATGDNLGIEQWCSLFVSEEQLLTGLDSRHPAIKGPFIRYLHGIYFSRNFEDTTEVDDDGQSRDLMFASKQKEIYEVFKDMRAYIRLFLLMEQSDEDLITLPNGATMCEEEEIFENIVIDTVLPFFKSFFAGDWPLNLLFDEAVEPRDQSKGRESNADPRDRGSQILNKMKTLLHICSTSGKGSVVGLLTRLAALPKVQSWENARVSVTDALTAASKRLICPDMLLGLMIDPDSPQAWYLYEALQKLEEFERNMEAEGVGQDEENELIEQRRKRAVVRSALPRFMECFLETCKDDTGRGGGMLSLMGTRTVVSAGTDIDAVVKSLCDPCKDPFFDVFVDTLRSHIMSYIKSESMDARDRHASDSHTSLNGQLLNLTEQSLDDAVEALGYDVDEAESGSEDEGGDFQTMSRRFVSRMPSLTERFPDEVQTDNKKAERHFRKAAFSQFTNNSKRYMLKLLAHLCGYTSEDYTECDIYLSKALEKLLESQRDNILETKKRTPNMTSSELSKQIALDDVKTKLTQCAFINLGGPNAVMALVSLGHSNLNPYYANMVPQANNLGNSLLAGGNFEVQKKFFDIFVEKKSSFERHQEENFLRSLQYQIRNVKNSYLNPNLNLQNKVQLSSMTLVRERAVSLLKFIQNLVEGHKSEHQEFMLVQPSVTETVNIVKEVGNLYVALFEFIESELRLVEDVDFNSKLAPLVAGNTANPTSAAVFGRFKVVAWHENIDFTKLALVLPVLSQALHTMQELCAGPCVPNQLAFVRTGVCNTFPKLFAFFGALQLRQVHTTTTKKMRKEDEYNKKAGQNVFGNFKDAWEGVNEDLSTSLLVEASLLGGSYKHSFGPKIPPGAKWIGNDPALLFLLFRLKMDQEAKREMRVNETYPDDVATFTALNGAIKRGEREKTEGGWILEKKLFVAAQNDTRWTSEVNDEAEWRYNRELREVPRNIYTNIELLTQNCFEAEEALVFFLLSLVEGGDVDEEVVDNVAQNWDNNIMFANAVNWSCIASESTYGMSTMNAARNTKEPANNLSVQYHILIESLADTGNMGTNFKNDWRDLTALRKLDMSSHGITNIGRVEVLGKNDQISVLYFPVPTIVSVCWLRPEVQACKEMILMPDDISKRSNPDEKIKDFMEQSEKLVDILEHEYMLHETRSMGLFGWLIAELGSHNEKFSYLALALSLVINLFILLEYRYSINGDDKLHGPDAVMRTTLPFFHFITASLVVVSYVISTGWRSIIVGFKLNPDSTFPVHNKILKKIVRTFQSAVHSAESENDRSVEVRIAGPILVVFYFFVSDWRAIYYLLLLFFSFWGIARNPLVYAVTMFDVVRMSSTMQKVIRSLTNNLDQVVVTVVFMVILIYVFAAYAFHNNFEYAFEDHSACQDGGEADTCGGKFHDWLLLHIDYGVINPLVWTDNSGPISSIDGTIFGFLYYFLVNLVITAIVSGIIIDTFAEMRSDRNEVVDNLRSSCFICDIEPEDFEQFGVKFSDHIKYDHNIWQYVWLAIHLRDKDKTLYSGTEMHVAPFIAKHSPKCMPIKKSRAIQGRVKDKATLPTLLRKMEDMDRTTNMLGGLLQDLKKKMDKQNEDVMERLREREAAFAPERSGVLPSISGRKVSGSFSAAPNATF
jgi:hypothetical protein